MSNWKTYENLKKEKTKTMRLLSGLHMCCFYRSTFSDLGLVGIRARQLHDMSYHTHTHVEREKTRETSFNNHVPILNVAVTRMS